MPGHDGSFPADCAEGEPRPRCRWPLQPEKLWVPGALSLGLILGLALPPQAPSSSSTSSGYRHLSGLLGWTYFFAWSASFYPQVVHNFARRSVAGLSLDYQLLNLVGFLCYFAFNALLFCNEHVREEYREQHGGHDSAVRLNDVLFSGHATFITAVTLLQIWVYYDYPRLRGADRVLRWVVVSSLGLVVLAAAAIAAAVAADSERHLSWLTYLSLLSETKVVISILKYCPQVWMNYRRKSTEGWNIYNVLLDFSGGLLSVSQLLLDANAAGDWSAVSGDPVKLLLGNLSMVFDVVFMLQHYCFYAKAARDVRPSDVEAHGAPAPLLTSNGQPGAHRAPLLLPGVQPRDW